MKRLCNECGSELIFVDRSDLVCPFCHKTINFKNTISESTLKFRMTQLKEMHNLMIAANDETIYGRWICTGVPDEPNEDDFEYIALNNESYNECFDLFVKLIANKNCRY